MIDLVSTQITPQEKQWLCHPAVGGVILFTRNFESHQQLRELVDEIHAIKSPSL
jgi:beta-N-acetylhexosaminidase